MTQPLILITQPSADYALLDSGDGEKLERYANFVISRPDPQALWPKRLPQSEWQKAGAVFSRENEKAGWQIKNQPPKNWQAKINGLTFGIKLSAFKHTGIFPEQAGNWEWIKKILNDSKTAQVLNLFGYTGGATLAAAQAGAEVCHLDGSKPAVHWASENAALSGLDKKPIRWIIDDARAFVQREIKRGRRYDGIIMDPPAFGHGPKGEMWRIEEDFLKLLELCQQVLSPQPLFFLINGYASGYSAIAYQNNLLKLQERFGGKLEIGELTIKEEGKDGRLLPCGIFARWSKI